MRDGEIIDKVELNEANGWTYTWTDLAKGPEYTVTEVSVPGYTFEITKGAPSSDQPAGWYKVDTIEEGGVYLLVSADGYILTGNPNADGAYDFGAGNWTQAAMENGVISPDGITDDMKWNAVSLSGRDGLYLKNLPADKKHYLSYQNTDTVKAASSNTDYVSRVESCADGLRLHKRDNIEDVKYVVKLNNTTKASDTNANVLFVYKLSGSGADSEFTYTITNTWTGEEYELPSTGGHGTAPYTLSGLLMMAAGILLLRKRRRMTAVS